MKALARRHTEKGRQLARIIPHILDHLIERCVSEIVSIVGKKQFVAPNERLNSFQPLADIRMKPRVNQRNIPSINLAGEVPNLFSP